MVGCVEPTRTRTLGEYSGEGLVFAAVPLHAPVPVLHVLSVSPRLRRPAALAAPSDLDLDETAPVPRYKSAATGKQRLRPPAYRDTDYEESYEYTRLAPALRPAPAPATPAFSYEDEYESYAPQPAPAPTQVYSTLPLPQPRYEPVYAGSAELYARPLPSGGYTYRRAAPKVTAPPPVKPTKEPPYIIKIHKYRIVKDRRRR